jgi:menaquinone-dependent protoporphyrinogen IX oxidase
MSKNILVIYATKSGSTADIAQFIRDTLIEGGAQATSENVKGVEIIEPYSAVFIGSPIINGKCMPEIKEFVRTHTPLLSQKAVAYFITCMRLSQVAGDSLPDVPIYVDPGFGDPKQKSEMTFPEKTHPITMYLNAISGMAKDIKPISVSFFRGVLDYSTIGFMMTLLFKIMARVDGLEPGDYRNWEAISLWTRATYSRL